MSMASHHPSPYTVANRARNQRRGAMRSNLVGRKHSRIAHQLIGEQHCNQADEARCQQTQPVRLGRCLGRGELEGEHEHENEGEGESYDGGEREDAAVCTAGRCGEMHRLRHHASR